MIKPALILSVFLFSGLFSVLLDHPPDYRQEDIIKYLDQLRSSDPEVRSKAVTAILKSKSQIKDRRSLVNEIEIVAREFVGNEERAGTAKTAIVLLGDLEAVESIPFLIEHLTFETFYKQTKRPQSIDDLYPCSGALIKIGMPSIDPLMAKVEKSENEKVTYIAAFVMKMVLRDGTSAYIQEHIGRQSNYGVRERLSRLRQYAYQF